MVWQMTIKDCIDYCVEHELITLTNHADLIECLEDYKELDRRTSEHHAQYYLGEEVYSAKNYFSDNKNKICKFTIESISWDSEKKKFIYNYLYDEDEIYSDPNLMLLNMKQKLESEIDVKMSKASNEVKKLMKGVDYNAKG